MAHISYEMEEQFVVHTDDPNEPNTIAALVRAVRGASMDWHSMAKADSAHTVILPATPSNALVLWATRYHADEKAMRAMLDLVAPLARNVLPEPG